MHSLTGLQHQACLDTGSFQGTKDIPDLDMNTWLIKVNGQAAENCSSIRQITTILVRNLVTLQFGVNTWKLHPIPVLFLDLPAPFLTLAQNPVQPQKREQTTEANDFA